LIKFECVLNIFHYFLNIPMGRPAIIDKLPPNIRVEFERRVRQDKATAKSLVEWLAAQGHAIECQAVNRYANRIRAKVAQAEAQAEVTIATHQAAKVSGVDIKFDLLDGAKSKLQLELQHYQVGQGLTPAQLFGAIARVTAVDVQIHKFLHDLKSKLITEIHSLEGEDGIDLETLKMIRERVYGVFDAAEE
jgi:hypothetical protein